MRTLTRPLTRQLVDDMGRALHVTMAPDGVTVQIAGARERFHVPWGKLLLTGAQLRNARAEAIGAALGTPRTRPSQPRRF